MLTATGLFEKHLAELSLWKTSIIFAKVTTLKALGHTYHQHCGDNLINHKSSINQSIFILTDYKRVIHVTKEGKFSVKTIKIDHHVHFVC